MDVPLSDVYEGADGSTMVKYDFLAKRDTQVQGGDIGELAVPRREIRGRVWHDADYDGLQAMTTTQVPRQDGEGNPVVDDDGNPVMDEVTAYDESEPGLEGETVALSQYYYDETMVNQEEGDPNFGTHSIRNTDFCVAGFNNLVAIATGDWAEGAYVEDGRVYVKTNGEGVYSFKNLPTTYIKNLSADEVGKVSRLRLASYRVELMGLHEDEEQGSDGATSSVPWMMTRFHVDKVTGEDGATKVDVHADSDIDDSQPGTLDAYALQGRIDIVDELLGDDTVDPVGVRGGKGQLILAGPIHGVDPGQQTAQVTIPAEDVVEGAAGTVVYDMMRARFDEEEAYHGGDAGQLPIPTRSLAGRVWRDADYNGLQSADTGKEPGIPGVQVTLEQWYFDPAAPAVPAAPGFLDGDFDEELNFSGKIDAAYTSQWVRNANFASDGYTAMSGRVAVVAGPWAAGASVSDGVVSVLTDDEGVYRFDNLPTAYTDPATGKHYLAAYRVKLVDSLLDNEEGAWMMTRYHQGGEEALELDSDLPDNLGLDRNYPLIGREVATEGDGLANRYLGMRQEMLEGQVILANAAGTTGRGARAEQVVPATDYVNDLTGELVFDWMDARPYRTGADAVNGGDAGQLPPPVQDIVGVLWNDANNDGIQGMVKVERNADGTPVLDAEGNTVPVLDAHGNPALERTADGTPVLVDELGNMVQATDADGNPVFESDGVTPVWLTEHGMDGISVKLERYYTADEGTTWVSHPFSEAEAKPYVDAGLVWDSADGTLRTMTAELPNAFGDERHGIYRFDDMQTQGRVDADGDGLTEMVIYGFRVKIDEPDWRMNRMASKFRQSDDRTRDSDLVYETDSPNKSYLMDGGEYIVLLEAADAGSVPANRQTGATSNNPNKPQDPAAASLASSRSVATFAAEGAGARDGAATGSVSYDRADGSDGAFNDGGLFDPASQSIAGYLWVDENYNGLRDEGEEPLENRIVLLQPWKWNDETKAWEKLEAPNPQATDAKGYYRFDNLYCSSFEENADGTGHKDYLIGYTVEVLGAPTTEYGLAQTVQGMPVANLLVADEGNDQNSKAHRVVEPADAGVYGAGNYPLAWYDGTEECGVQQQSDGVVQIAEGRYVVDGRIVLAAAATEEGEADGGTQDVYRVTVGEGTGENATMEFDMAVSASEVRMDGGFLPRDTSEIRGIVWEDENYNGLRDYVAEGFDDPDSVPETITPGLEKPVSGQRMFLIQEYLDDNGQWVLNSAFQRPVDRMLETGDLRAGDDFVLVKNVVDDASYRLVKVEKDADGTIVETPASEWYGASGRPWPAGEEGRFQDGADAASATPIAVEPLTEYKVESKRVANGADEPGNPMYVFTTGTRIVRGEQTGFAVEAGGTTLAVVEAPEVDDADLAVENGFEYTIGDPDDEGAEWVAADGEGLASFARLSHTSDYVVSVRVRGNQAYYDALAAAAEPAAQAADEGSEGDGDGAEGDGSEGSGGEGEGDEGEGPVFGDDVVFPSRVLDSVAIATLPNRAGTSVGYTPAATGITQDTVTPTPFGARMTLSDAQGIYRFGDLPSYLQKSAADGSIMAYGALGATDKLYLVRYRVSCAEPCRRLRHDPLP